MDEEKAFPHSVIDFPGMSLRDYFAIRIFQGHLSHYGDEGTSYNVYDFAYKCADKMMKARDK